MKPNLILLIFITCWMNFLSAQLLFKGEIKQNARPASHAVVNILELGKTFQADSSGYFEITIPKGQFTFKIHTFDSYPLIESVDTKNYHSGAIYIFNLRTNEKILNEVVVSGGLKEINRLQSIVPVEVYNPTFFKKNPTANLYEALQNINGVRPQLNCNICNTGDIHINGLEGPYSMILIDGMPLISSLATVYGLSGIPSSLIERVEIMRGPSSSLYGSEAIGGIINVITKNAFRAPKLTVDIFSNTWLETNADIGFKTKWGKRIFALTGINYFNYSNPLDQNNDNFTDITLQKRVSVFQKMSFSRKSNKSFNIAGRYIYEDRWGGEMNWTPTFRGTDSIYGESIYTTRGELFGNYELPTKEKIMLSGSFNSHFQNSYYGTTSFQAEQHVLFGQAVWYKTTSRHDMITGVTTRYTIYDDNTAGTSSGDSINPKNVPNLTFLPGIFYQDDWTIRENQKILLGVRLDLSSVHGPIITPRIGYKWTVKSNQTLRFNAGTGYRVVNVFTEDHASLTGARKTEILEDLKPERSINMSFNYYGTFYSKKGNEFRLDISPFYTYFINKIIPDYTTDPTKIIYKNSEGYAESMGISLNLEYKTDHMKYIVGSTLMNISKTENGVRSRQPLTEQFTSTWSISYMFEKVPVEINYTGNLYGPMILPLLGPLDPRPEYSPWWSIQNIQCQYKFSERIELYLGVKNLLNWTPGKKSPFLIARAHDPFDKQVIYEPNGAVQVNTENPYGMTFDPTYVYAPNQGIRFFFGLRINLK